MAGKAAVDRIGQTAARESSCSAEKRPPHPLIGATAKSLKANENSGVLKTDDAFQIVMVCHREVEDISEKENNMIAHSISEHKMSLKMQRFFSNLKKSAYVKIID